MVHCSFKKTSKIFTGVGARKDHGTVVMDGDEESSELNREAEKALSNAAPSPGCCSHPFVLARLIQPISSAGPPPHLLSSGPAATDDINTFCLNSLAFSRIWVVPIRSWMQVAVTIIPLRGPAVHEFGQLKREPCSSLLYPALFSKFILSAVFEQQVIGWRV